MTIKYQFPLSPAIPNIYEASGYREFCNQLEDIDTLLCCSGAEESLVYSALKRR